MKKMAEIYKAKVWAIHEVPDDFEVTFNPQSFRFAVDVTNEDPMPEQGWDYNAGTGEFTAPSAPPFDYTGNSEAAKKIRARILFNKGETAKALKTLNV